MNRKPYYIHLENGKTQTIYTDTMENAETIARYLFGDDWDEITTD